MPTQQPDIENLDITTYLLEYVHRGFYCRRHMDYASLQLFDLHMKLKIASQSI